MCSISVEDWARKTFTQKGTVLLTQESREQSMSQQMYHYDTISLNRTIHHDTETANTRFF
jgi:hypothetical protein